jgi:hypothetical protein
VIELDTHERLSLVNEAPVLMYKGSEMAGNDQAFLAGVNFSATLGNKPFGPFKADGQGELLHPAIGLTGFANKIFESGGTCSPQVLKFQLVGHL